MRSSFVAVLLTCKLFPVPLDLDTSAMAPKMELVEKAFSPKTRLLVIAHIFGARLDIAPWLALARQRGVLVVDDCAEIFEGCDSYTGHAEADLSVCSFGSIKTCSALGGSVGRVRDPAILARMRQIHANYAVRGKGTIKTPQSCCSLLRSNPSSCFTTGRLFWAKRVLTYMFLRSIQSPLLCGLSARAMEMVGVDLDTFITNSVRGFAGMDLIYGIRHQAPLGMLTLLERKLRTFDKGYIAQRVRLATILVEALRSPNVGELIERTISLSLSLALSFSPLSCS
jgi:perosamine synthetase